VAESATYLQAIQSWQHQVQNDQVRVFPLRCQQAGGTIERSHDAMPFSLEVRSCERVQIMFVVDYQDCCHDVLLLERRMLSATQNNRCAGSLM
jgi:hypothetical protein